MSKNVKVGLNFSKIKVCLKTNFDISSTSKNPCYAQATWDWICLKKTNQDKNLSKTKQNKNKQTNKKLRIKGPTWTFPTTSMDFR